MKKTATINKMQRLTYMFTLLFLSILFSQSALAQFDPPCGVNGITYTQQAGFGGNDLMIIGGYGQNDGVICWNCYSDSSYYGRHRAYNYPTGAYNPAYPVPHWSSRIFQDIPKNVLRIQSGYSSCYDSIVWGTGLSILNTGGVGIGTDVTFGAKLAVNGRIYTSGDVEINTNLAWPDYVFASEYRLPTIHDFEKEVMQLGYIPQIGSAQQLKENGHNLGEMQTKQMEVIEMLLRYQFDMNNRLEKLETENKELKDRLKFQSSNDTISIELQLLKSCLKDNVDYTDEELKAAIQKLILLLLKPENE